MLVHGEKINAPSSSTWHIIGACFLASGFAGLLYQTVWMRQFGIVFGTAETAVAATLAAYMAGLGIGAYAGGCFATRARRPLLVYVTLEAAIAITALLVPSMIEGLHWLLNHAVSLNWVDHQALSVNLVALYTLGTFLILMLPTAFMGATLPILLRFVVSSDQHIGARTGSLYGLNTLGAVLGALTTAFILLPSAPLSSIVWIGATLNVLAALGAFLLRKQQLDAKPEIRIEFVAASAKVTPTLRIFSIAVLASGFVSFSLEVLWTRLLGHIAGGSIFAFAVMLSTFLTGIAIGSIAIKRFSQTAEAAGFNFAMCQIGIAMMSVATYGFLGQLIPDNRTWLSIIGMSAAVMLPVTLLIGATFPLAVRAATHEAENTPNVAGRLYAMNTIGAILGALTASFALLPHLGFEGTVRTVSLISCAVALITVIRFSSIGPYAVGTTLIAALIISISPLKRPDTVIGTSTLTGESLDDQELFYSVGRSATVFAAQMNGFINLRTNGLPEASIAVKGSPPVRNSQQWLGALPMLAKPDAKDVLVVGLGGGVALEGLPNAKDIDITVVEIEAEVLAANGRFENLRRMPVLNRENVDFIINDARSSLSLSQKTFDVIVSQPSHPWTAGASHLYTEEFIQLAKQRLNQNGVLLQWINSAFLDASLLRSITATLTSQFKNVMLFQPAPGVLEFLASDSDLDSAFSLEQLESTLRQRHILFGDLGIQSPLDVIASLTLTDFGTRSLAGNELPNNDDFNRLATQSKHRGDGMSPQAFNALTSNHDALCGDEMGRRYPLATQELFYVMRQWMLSGFEDRAASCINNLSMATKTLSSAYAMLLQRDINKAVELLEVGLNSADSYDESAYLLRKLSLTTSIPAVTRIEAIPNNTAAVATLNAWQAAQRGNWNSVSNLDAKLAKSAPKDIWYQDAAKLMAEWRIRTAIASGNTHHLSIALAILDSALSTQWTEELLTLRAGIAAILKDSDLYVATLNAYLNLLETRYRTIAGGNDKPEIDSLTQGRLSGILVQLKSDWLIDEESVGQLAKRIEDFIA